MRKNAAKKKISNNHKNLIPEIKTMYTTSLLVLLISVRLNLGNAQDEQQQPKVIKCGCDYLNNTIGISITENNQIYQMLYTNQTLQVIKYEQQINGKRISTVNNKPNSYRMNLIDGHYYYHLNQLIQSPDVYKKLLDLFKLGIDDKSTQQQISRLGATIMIDDDHVE